MQVCFGSCVLDTDTREVLRDGRPIHLTPLAYRLLELLIRYRPRALTKAELQDALWPGVFVTEASLSSLVADLRSAIGDEARGSTFIRTVHRHGYAFAGEATVLAVSSATGASRSYRLMWLSREVTVSEGETILGRSRHPREPVLVEAFVPQPPVERFDVGAFCVGLPGSIRRRVTRGRAPTSALPGRRTPIRYRCAVHVAVRAWSRVRRGRA